MTNRQGHKALSLADLETNLLNAQTAYDQCQRVAAAARRDETAALNRLNDAQKQFDQHVDDMRKGAKAGDWADRARKMTGVCE